MGKVAPIKYMCDFETVVSTERTRVWLWGAVTFGTHTFKHGTEIESFIDYVSRSDSMCFFHNLKFDIQFIFYWLFQHGYKHSGSKQLDPGYFSTLISDMGVFYSIKLCTFKGTTVTFRDSLKLLQLPVAEIPAAFGIDENKLEIDYEEIRDLNHVPTQQEIDYQYNDCIIPCKALEQMFSQGLTKMTTAANALNFYKGMMDKKTFKKLFPKQELRVDADCRNSYRGGWTYVNPKYQGQIIGNGCVYDVNSMYPWGMSTQKLPIGDPIYYDGKYEHDKLYDLYIECMSCCFKLKKGHYPSIQLKGSTRFIETEYLAETGDEPQLLYLTNIDHDLLFYNYDVWNVKYICGYKFRSRTGVFKEYIDYWFGVKTQADIEGNKGLRKIAKLMLNSLYGKFGTNPIKKSKYPWYDKESDIVRYSLGMEEETDGLYVPIASFITSYARDRIIRAAVACGDRFVYADTDSVHILGDEEPDLEIDDHKLGYFALESRFKRAKFYRSKCYIEEIITEEGTKLNKKCAGLPEKAREEFNFDTMDNGYVFHGKLRPKIVPGGMTLVPVDFQIKEKK